MTRFNNGHSANWLLAGAIAIALFCLGAFVDRQAYYACWLAAWWTCAGAVLGSQANLWLHDLTGGAWGLPLRPIWRRAAAAMPMLLALMLPLVVAAWTFYPWAQPGWTPQAEAPAFKAAWLSPPFVTVRLLVYAALWQATALMSARHEAYWTAREIDSVRGRAAASADEQYERPQPGKRRKGGSAFCLLVYGLTVSLASVDLVQSLMPQWYSSGFGLIAAAMQMKLGFALGVLGASAPGQWQTTPGQRSAGHAGPVAPGEDKAVFPAEMGRDWGNLLLMYVLMWAYVGFVQFLIIWAENLPNEIAWYVPRLQTGWVWLGGTLVAAGFFTPLFLLLFRSVKQNRQRLRGLAMALCMLGWAESVWVTLPSVPGLTWHALWMAPLALAGMAALLRTMPLPGEHRMRQRPIAATQVQEGE